MAINIRTKGQAGEREVCDLLNNILNTILLNMGLSKPVKPVFQRNQNQSAVGGSDITNPFGLCIEVKRQETLQINQWWKQCETAASEFGGIPILIYRQNGKRKWNVVMNAWVNYSAAAQTMCRATIEQGDFEFFVERYIRNWIDLNGWNL